jgi:hypothetical protein
MAIFAEYKNPAETALALTGHRLPPCLKVN